MCRCATVIELIAMIHCIGAVTPMHAMTNPVTSRDVAPFTDTDEYAIHPPNGSASPGPPLTLGKCGVWMVALSTYSVRGLIAPIPFVGAWPT